MAGEVGRERAPREVGRLGFEASWLDGGRGGFDTTAFSRHFEPLDRFLKMSVMGGSFKSLVSEVSETCTVFLAWVVCPVLLGDRDSDIRVLELDGVFGWGEGLAKGTLEGGEGVGICSMFVGDRGVGTVWSFASAESDTEGVRK